MAFETERGNFSHVTDAISDALGPALVKQVVVMPLIYTEDVPEATAVKKFRKAGSVTAVDLAESTAHTYVSGDEYTETEVTATAGKTVSFLKLTVESDRFESAGNQRVIDAAGNAIARQMDAKIKALFDGFSQQQTAASTLTVNDLLDAAYKVYNGDAGMADQLVAVLDHKGLNEIRKEVNSSSAAIYNQAQRSTLLDGSLLDGRGFAGSIPGVDIYATSGLPTASTDDVAVVMNPNLAFGGIVDPTIMVQQTFRTVEGMYTEFAAYLFNAFVEWYDEAGVGVLSDT